MATGLNTVVQGELRHLNATVELTRSQIKIAADFVREYSHDKISSTELVQVKKERCSEDISEKEISEEYQGDYPDVTEQAGTVISDC